MDLRSTEVKEKIEKLAKELAGMKEKIDSEQREFSPEEIDKANKLADELDGLEVSLDSALAEERANDRLQSLKQSQRPSVRPDLKKSEAEDRKFRNFGEQLTAIARYYATGEMNYKLRAATGLSEGVPSDGGLA